MANENQTKIADLINPEVMADMISGKIDNAIVVTPFAKIDTTLTGTPGDEVTVPMYAYIGDAEDVAEGVKAGTTKLATSTKKYQVKKVMKAVNLTDEAVLSGFGNPVGETNSQLAKAIASKIDSDSIDALLDAQLIFVSEHKISYDGIVDAIDLFVEEINTQKVMFVHPKQVTTLRKDPDFIGADKYDGKIIMTGEIGRIANAAIVPSRRVPLIAGKYNCPIVKVETETQTEDETPALTIYLKRDTNVETERNTLERSTDISADKHYIAALSNAAKVVVAKFATDEPPVLAFVSGEGDTSGKTAISDIAPAKGASESYVYQTGKDLALPSIGQVLTGSAWTAWAGSVEITAEDGLDIVIATIVTATKACVNAGKQTVVSKE